MPQYEYRCPKCNHRFEVNHVVGGNPGPCPVCGSLVRRIFSSVGLIFKGKGFHTTDYRKATTTSDGAATDGKPGAKTPAADTPKPDGVTSKPPGR